MEKGKNSGALGLSAVGCFVGIGCKHLRKYVTVRVRVAVVQ